MASAVSPSMCAWPTSMQMPRSVPSKLRSSISIRSGAVERLLPITSSATFTPSGVGHPVDLLDAADGRLAIVVVRCRMLRDRDAQMHDEEREWNGSRDVQRGCHLVQRRLSRVVVACAR